MQIKNITRIRRWVEHWCFKRSSVQSSDDDPASGSVCKKCILLEFWPLTLKGSCFRFVLCRIAESFRNFCSMMRGDVTFWCITRNKTLNINTSVIWYLMSLWSLFGMTLLMNKFRNIVMDNGWVHPLAKTLTFLLAATCDEILSWMIEIWMNNHLVRDSTCNTANL